MHFQKSNILQRHCFGEHSSTTCTLALALFDHDCLSTSSHQHHSLPHYGSCHSATTARVQNPAYMAKILDQLCPVPPSQPLACLSSYVQKRCAIMLHHRMTLACCSDHRCASYKHRRLRSCECALPQHHATLHMNAAGCSACCKWHAAISPR